MCKSISCGCIAAFLGAIFGIIIGVLFFLGTITATAIVTPIIIALSIAAFVLALLIILLSIAEFRGRERAPVCLCRNAIGLVITSVLTILAAIATFAITLAAGSVGIAILIGIGAGAFFATLVQLVCWLICIVEENCDCDRA